MTRHALLVGTDVHQDPRLPALSTPVADADAFARLLRDPGCGFFDDVVVLANPTSGELTEAINVVTTDRSPEDTVLVFISGHGLVSQRGRLHFATTNTRHTHIAGTSVAASFLNEQLQDCFAGAKVLLLDTCYSGRFATGLTSKSAFDPRLSAELGKGYVVLTAAESTEFAFEGTGSSYFTAAVMQALRTPDADQDGDGLISTADLYAYIARSATVQRPTYMAAGVTGKVIVSAAAGRSGPAVVALRAEPTPPMSLGAHMRALAKTIDELGLENRHVWFACDQSLFPVADARPKAFATEPSTGSALGGTAAVYSRFVALDPAALAILPVLTAPRGAFVRSHVEASAQWDRGWIAIGHNWWEEAYSELAAAVRAEPLDAAAWWGLGVCQVQAGRWSSASDSFQRAARYVRPYSLEQYCGAVLLHWAASRLGGGGDDTVLLQGRAAARNCSELLAALGVHHGHAELLAWAVKVDVGLWFAADALGIHGIDMPPAQENEWVLRRLADCWDQTAKLLRWHNMTFPDASFETPARFARFSASGDTREARVVLGYADVNRAVRSHADLLRRMPATAFRQPAWFRQQTDKRASLWSRLGEARNKPRIHDLSPRTMAEFLAASRPVTDRKQQVATVLGQLERSTVAR
jgi:hypothetical protein